MVSKCYDCLGLEQLPKPEEQELLMKHYNSVSTSAVLKTILYPSIAQVNIDLEWHGYSVGKS